MLLSQVPAKIPLPFATNGSKNAIPEASQIPITPGAASLTDGFPPLTFTPLAAGGIAPFGEDMNGILFELSAIVRWANAGGGYLYDSTFANDVNVGGYPKGARILRSDGTGYWFNTIDNNIVDPEANAVAAIAAGWVPDFTNGIAAITMTNANITLTPLQYGKPIIIISGVLVANLNLIFPTGMSDQWTVINNTTGAYTITCKTAAGTGVVIISAQLIVGDGTNIYYGNLNQNISHTVTTRQTVSLGPVDTNGLPAFGGSTGSTTVTVSGTLVATAANGSGPNGNVDHVASIINPSWTGLSTNGQNYLYLDISTDGTATPAHSLLAPAYQPGGAYSTTNDQFTFNYLGAMSGQVGNGVTAAQAYRVYVGEVTVAGGVVTAITWYALNGLNVSVFAAMPAASSTVSLNHNIGCREVDSLIEIICTSADSTFSIGDIVPGISSINASNFVTHIDPWSTRLATGFSTDSPAQWARLVSKTGGGGNITLASWNYRIVTRRRF